MLVNYILDTNMKFRDKRDSPLGKKVTLNVSFSLDQGYNPIDCNEPITISEYMLMLTNSDSIELNGQEYSRLPSKATVTQGQEGKEIIKTIVYRRV